MAVVYIHRRLDNNKVFYVGVGLTYKRAFSKFGRNKWWKNISEKYGYSVEIICENVSNEDARELEVLLIEIYGRADLNNGYLTNLTDGGDGLKNHNFTDNHKKKISIAQTGSGNSFFGKKHSKETLAIISFHSSGINSPRYGKEGHFKGKKFTDTHKENLSKSLKGRIITDANKEKLSNLKKGIYLNTETGIYYFGKKEAGDTIGISGELLWYRMKYKKGFPFIKIE